MSAEKSFGIFNQGPLRALILLAATGMLAVGLFVNLSGCCTVGVGPCTMKDQFTLTGANDLNACGNDDLSHPVAVRFYALKEAKSFQASTFEDIWNNPGQTLGGDLVGDPEKVFLEPGGQEIVSLVRLGDVQAIGVLANFCDQNDNTDRRKVFLLGKRGVKKALNLRGINMTVE